MKVDLVRKPNLGQLFLTLLIPLLLVGPVLVGCSGAEEPEPTGEPPETATVYTVRGVYLGSAFDGAGMRVDHEEIPGFMDAMTMSFRIQSPDAIAQLNAGDKIEFRFVSDSFDSFADRIEVLDPDTELVLSEN